MLKLVVFPNDLRMAVHFLHFLPKNVIVLVNDKLN